MDVINYLYKAFGKATNNKSGNNATVGTFRLAGNAMPPNPPLTFDEFFRGWAAICIDYRAKIAAGKKSFAVYEQANGENEKPVVNNHWYNALVKRPNSFTKQSWFDIQRLLFEWLDYYGNAYLYMPTNGAQYPVQAWVLPSNRVWINPGTNSIAESYSFSNNNGVHILPASEVCHFKTLHPSNILYSDTTVGIPMMLKAAEFFISSDTEKAKFLARTYKGDGIQYLTINTPEGDASSSFGLEWFKQLKETINGLPNINSKVATLLDKGARFEPVPVSPLAASGVSQDLATNQNATVICTAFGVPIGLLDGASNTFATAKVSRQLFNENTIDPLLTAFESTLTIHLNQYDPAIKITHKAESFVDAAEEIQKYTFMLRHGIINRNELRAKEGLDSIEGGDVYLLDSTLVNAEIALNPPPPPTNPPLPEKTPQSENEAAKAPVPVKSLKEFLNGEGEKKNPIRS